MSSKVLAAFLNISFKLNAAKKQLSHKPERGGGPATKEKPVQRSHTYSRRKPEACYGGELGSPDILGSSWQQLPMQIVQ